MRRAAWIALAVLAFLLAAALIVGAFTRFDGDRAASSPAELERMEREQYADARLSALLGVAGCFTLLAGAACAQQAWRTRTSS